MMNYRKDKYGNELSLLGFGCMRFQQTLGRIDLEEAKREQFETLVKQLAEKTTLWRMYCNMDPAAAEVSHKAMSE